MVMIISDEIIKDKEKPNLRKITLDIPFDVLTYFLQKDKSVNSYSDLSSFQSVICFWNKNFLTSADFYKNGKQTIVIFYPYDKMETLAKNTKRDYLREKELCAKFIIKFAEKVKKLKVRK
jgi:hypothetical protein